MTVEERYKKFLEKAKLIHGDRYDYSKVNYVKGDIKVEIVCSRHGSFYQRPHDHLKGRGCPKCGYEDKVKRSSLRSVDDFIIDAKALYGDKYDYSKADYRGAKEKVLIRCNDCGYEFWQRPNDHLSGKGCPKCGKTLKKGVDDFIIDAKKIHGNKYDYSRVLYFDNKTSVEIVCPEHGVFWQRPDNHLSGQGCPKCKQSKMENEILQTLVSNSISFETQKTFDWLVNPDTKYHLFCDFYLPEYNTVIECQGEQHFESVEHFGGETEFWKIKKRDEQKNFLCRAHGVNVLYYVPEGKENECSFSDVSDLINKFV